MAAAKYLLDGLPGTKALQLAGFSRWSSRHFGELLRQSWPLREALRLETERRQHNWLPRPQRKRRDKYDSRRIASGIREYVITPEDRTAESNRPIQKRHRDYAVAKSIMYGDPMPPPLRTPKYETSPLCPGCGAKIKRAELFLNQSGTAYVCLACCGGGA